jgi:hypothetical protein
MFFKNYTVYKVYLTRKGAEAFINRYKVQAHIEVIDNKFYVVG